MSASGRVSATGRVGAPFALCRDRVRCVIRNARCSEAGGIRAAKCARRARVSHPLSMRRGLLMCVLAAPMREGLISSA
jgi:hypothetical protein